MSAFHSYSGAYEHEGQTFSWRCYANSRVHAVRHREHGPFPKAPPGRKWLTQPPSRREPEVGWLVDDRAEHFSHILFQIHRGSPHEAYAVAV
jgi:hypothetical protein